MAEDRVTLIAMGFAPDRVDWAIRATPADADLQTRLDHIFEHEQETIPIQPTPATPAIPVTTSITSPAAPTITTPLYSPPNHPPPSQTLMPSNPPPIQAASTLQGISESMGRMSFAEPSPIPSEATGTAGPMETEAIQRYKSFLSAHSDHLRNLSNNQDAAKTFYDSLTRFLEEEATKWRTDLRIPVETAETVPVPTSHVAVERDPVPVGTPEPTQPSPEADATLPAEAVAPSNELQSSESRKEYDCIGVYDPSRSRIAILDSAVDFLADVITGYGEDDFVENARKRAWDIRPRMSEEVSNLRWKVTVETSQTVSDDGFQRRSEAHYQRLNELQPMEDWEIRNRLQQEYEEQERLIRQRTNREDHQKYCQTFLDPAREMIHRAFTDIHPIYAEIKGYLEAEIPDLDVVRAVRALEQVSDAMELGMKELETLEDDRIEREWILQRELITDDQTRTDPYGDANKLEKEKEHRMLEIRAMRATQKVNRRADFYALVGRRMREAIAGVDKDYETLQGILKQLLESIPETIPLQEEEARAQSGDDSAMKIPLPSKELDTQIRSAQSAIYSVNGMRHDMRDVLRSFERKQTAERRENDMAQLAVNESRQGRADNWYFQAGRLLSDKAEKEDEETEKVYRRDQEQRREEFNEFMAPVSSVVTRYKDREMLVLQKLASGMTAHGPMASSSSSSTAGGGTDALSAMQKMMQQQQQTQMLSNMMWSQHAARMSVINNIGSSNTQWVVRYS
ncbi:hypothetical protein FRC17_005633 [Serendipita sp. 399]|nr:hypothetical protein FRC17_005633 [Serendipita sp. 399]